MSLEDLAFPTDAHSKVRRFETGATRDTEDGKHDPEGFSSPLVELRFCEYMTANRVMKDGSLRDSDNWQLGITKESYAKSLKRHMLDFHLHHRGHGERARDPIEEALCAIIFNASGYLDRILKGR